VPPGKKRKGGKKGKKGRPHPMMRGRRGEEGKRTRHQWKGKKKEDVTVRSRWKKPSEGKKKKKRIELYLLKRGNPSTKKEKERKKNPILFLEIKEPTRDSSRRGKASNPLFQHEKKGGRAFPDEGKGKIITHTRGMKKLIKSKLEKRRRSSSLNIWDSKGKGGGRDHLLFRRVVKKKRFKVEKREKKGGKR